MKIQITSKQLLVIHAYNQIVNIQKIITALSTLDILRLLNIWYEIDKFFTRVLIEYYPHSTTWLTFFTHLCLSKLLKPLSKILDKGFVTEQKVLVIFTIRKE